MMQAFSDIPTFLLYVGSFVVALSLIVFVHEMGHYLVGRWTGIRAEVFSIGFGRTVFSGYDRHGTKWQVAMIPLGGYVKFLGDSSAASGVDEEMMSELDAETLRHTMHGAPLYARALTVIAGPAFNFALSILVFAGVFLYQGVAKEPPTVGKLISTPYGALDLQVNDQITAIGDTQIASFADIETAMKTLPTQAKVEYQVLRDGRALAVDGPFPFPARISFVQPQSAAHDAGLKIDDYVVAIDGQPIIAFSEVVDTVKATKDKPLDLTIWRDGAEMEFQITPRLSDLPLAEGGFESRYLIGMQGGGLFFEPATERPGPWQSVKFGADQTVSIITGSVSMLYNVVRGSIDRCNVRGVLTIAETSGATAAQGLSFFITFIAMLSTAIGFINLFPIPVLDGGHLMFHCYEALTGKPPSDRVLNVMMTVGLALVLGLMVFALSNDFLCR